MNEKISTWYQELVLDCFKLIAILKERAEKAALPVNVPVMPATPNAILLEKFCTAIRDYEGAPGDANYLNHNPGNCRYSEDGYLPKYEPVTRSPAGFAVFPSYAIGWMYLENMIKGRIHAHPNWSILTFMESYAPSSDNNDPKLYAQFIARRLGVAVDYQVKNLL